MGKVNIFCDVDGVLANFIGATCRLHEKHLKVPSTWEFYKDWGLSDEEFWEPIQALGGAFALEIEALPWAGKLLDMLRAEGDVRFLTAPWKSPEAWGGRVRWLVERMGARFEDIILCPGHLKAFFAKGKERNILIDDSEKNVGQWCRAGGVGFVWPGPSSSLHTAYANMCLEGHPDIAGLPVSDVFVSRLRRAIRRFRDYEVASGPVSWIQE